MKPILRAALLLMAVLCSVTAAADQRTGGQSVVSGDHEVHYAALNTMDIQPATARALQVRRSGNRALLVLNAQQQTDDGPLPVRATATGRATNLLGQDKNLSLRTVRDAEVWYVLAEFRIHDGEMIRFAIDVLPEGADTPVAVRFEQMFYREP